MKFKRIKINTVFYKLIASYVVIIILTASFVGVSTYISSSTNFRQEVINVNQKMLAHLHNFIDKTIIKAAEQTYLDIIGPDTRQSQIISLFENPTGASPTLIRNIYASLKELATDNMETIHAIHIYYKDAGLIVSSQSGVKYIRDSVSNLTINTDWIAPNLPQDPRPAATNTYWISTRPVPINTRSNSTITDLFSFVRLYPYMAAPRSMQGAIAVDISQEAIFNLIKHSSTNEHSIIMVIDSKGRTISHTNQDKLYEQSAKKEYIQKILRETYQSPSTAQTTSTPSGTTTNGPDGAIENGPDPELEQTRSLPLPNRIDPDNFIAVVDGTKSIISYRSLEKTNWILVNITPVNLFYNSAAANLRTTVFIVLITIIVGLIIADLFTIDIYTPLKNIIENIHNSINRKSGTANTQKPLKTSSANGAPRENEYTLINQAISNLSGEVDNLQKTLASNRPIIKHNLVNGLLRGTIHTVEEIKNRAKLLNIALSGPFYAAVIIEIDQKVITNLSFENNQYLTLDLIERIESLKISDRHGTDKNPGIGQTDQNHKDLTTSPATMPPPTAQPPIATCKPLAVELSQNQLGVLVSSSSAEDDLLIKIINRLNTYAISRYSLTVTACIGIWTKKLLRIHNSFNDLRKVLKYQYFFPQEHILMAKSFVTCEKSDKILPETILSNLTEKLNEGDLKAVKQILDHFVELARQKQYPADHCRRKTYEIVQEACRYLNNINLKSQEFSSDAINQKYNTLISIHDFYDWMVSLLEKSLTLQEEKKKNQNTETVTWLKEYITRHLNEELSLDAMAAKVYKSPAYLSKIFKDEAGENFLDFVINARLHKARELLAQTNLNIETIGQKVGFNTPHYFTKQFKKKFGTTPKTFRQNQVGDLA